MEFFIEKTWDDEKVKHRPVRISLETSSNCLLIKIDAPFFGEPEKPVNKQIGDVFNLWDYEVVEVFFLSDSGKYIELEFGPYGHYLTLLLNGPRKLVKEGLKIEYECKINGDSWSGLAKIPAEYFPSRVTKMNAYAIHGAGEARQYESLFPVPHSKYSNPDFHRMNYFQPLDFKSLLPSNFERDSENETWN